MIISSNTLFHFTNSAENIINIIKEGFKPKFCLEEFGSEFLISPIAKKLEQANPMCCFCDLPLSQINAHLEFYGSYGIGLSKIWGHKNGLTPICYIHDNSSLLAHFRKIGEDLFPIVYNAQKESKAPIHMTPLLSFMELSAYFKPYEGQMWRINKYVEKKFYDEREWRYVPTLVNIDNDYRLNKEEFLNEIKRASANDLLAKKALLKFTPSDIKYIIVKKENEMVELSDALENMMSIFSESEIKILKTKIISSEQIIEDF